MRVQRNDDAVVEFLFVQQVIRNNGQADRFFRLRISGIPDKPQRQPSRQRFQHEQQFSNGLRRVYKAKLLHGAGKHITDFFLPARCDHKPMPQSLQKFRRVIQQVMAEGTARLASVGLS